MELSTFFSGSQSSLDKATAKRLTGAWQIKHVAKDSCIVMQGADYSMETIVLAGRLSSTIADPDGRAVCVGFYEGPCMVTPAIARTRHGISLVSINATTDALIAQMESAALTELMLSSEPIRQWANGILQYELGRKAEREWCLAALGGADRLAWFRKTYPHHEELFSHSLIASFLGVTPVTLSRLRGADRDSTTV
ncbi:MAG: Crp/Fnr family transcriptional regulator [Hyphomicrobiales bacterium]|uniref:Crp/Fnr family transcriptional regulator n=1 Tax=Nisaea sp. TaxID=2024842 RepID=UPI003269A020